jgi:hypothetical protein
MDCGIDPKDSAIADRKKEKITIYAQMREANKKLDEMDVTKASCPSHEDESTSGSAPGSNSRFRVPLTTLTPLIGSSRTPSSNTASSAVGFRTSIQNIEEENAAATLPHPAPAGRKVLGGDSRTNGGGRNVNAARAAGRGGGRVGRGAEAGPVNSDK